MAKSRAKSSALKTEIKVTLPRLQAEIIDSLIGQKGTCAANVISTIVTQWLENEGLLQYVKKRQTK